MNEEPALRLPLGRPCWFSFLLLPGDDRVDGCCGDAGEWATAAELAVGVGSVHDADDGDQSVLIVDPINHAVGAPSGAVAVVERRTEPASDSMRVVE